MRTLFTFLAVACSYFSTAATGIPNEVNSKITGVIVDSIGNKPVEFATVALTDQSNGKTIDGTIADENGKFTLTKVAPGSYTITITFVGFETKVIPVKVKDKN